MIALYALIIANAVAALAYIVSATEAAKDGRLDNLALAALLLGLAVANAIVLAGVIA